MRAAVLVLLLAGCGVPPESASSVGKVWAVQAFVERRAVAAANAGQTFGGWAPADLVSEPGAGLLFSPGRVQADGFGLTVFPGVSEGAPLGFIISDIWQNHPAPWVQPVYSPLGPPLPDGGPNPLQVVFPVGAASTFYSPWWFQEFFDVAADPGSPSSSRAALEVGPRRPGALVLCPIISLSDGTEVRVTASLEPSSDGGAAVGVTRHPLTGQRLQSPGTASAWVDGETVKYLRLGAGRGRAEGQTLIESPMYVFTLAGRPLLTAAVFPAGAASRGFVRRWDVPLPPSAGIFVPLDKPEWRDALVQRRPDAGVERSIGTRADAGVGEFHEYGLRVARDKQCFDAPNFPAACTWLDSEARVLQLGTARETNVLLTIAVLGAQP